VKVQNAWLQPRLWVVAVLVAVSSTASLITAPSAAADPRGVFLCVENASDGPVRVLMNRANDTNAPGPDILQPGWSRCAESTPRTIIGIRPGENPIVGQDTWSWRVEGTRESFAVNYGIQTSQLWATWRNAQTWRGVGVNETRRATIPASLSPDDKSWKFILKRFPNNENVGGGLDTSGNLWIRYLLTINKKG